MSTINQRSQSEKSQRSAEINDKQLRAMMTQAMSDSLRDKTDTSNNNLIPATESFKGLFFSNDN